MGSGLSPLTPAASSLSLVDDEFYQSIVDPAVADKADFLPGQFRAVVNAGPAQNKLLVNAAGEKNDVRFALEVRAQRRRRRHIAELYFPGHETAHDAFGAAQDARAFDVEAMLVEQTRFPGHHHRSGPLSDGGEARVDSDQLRHASFPPGEITSFLS
jgi:hypothetical protein